MLLIAATAMAVFHPTQPTPQDLDQLNSTQLTGCGNQLLGWREVVNIDMTRPWSAVSRRIWILQQQLWFHLREMCKTSVTQQLLFCHFPSRN